MKKQVFTFFLFVGMASNLFAQNDTTEFWDHLLTNNREKAAKIAKKFSKNDIKEIVLSEIERTERGRFSENKAFLDSFIGQPDFEYYLYALWNEQYFFTSYLESGFNKNNIDHINTVYNTDLKNNTLQDAMHYLKGVSERYQGNWDAYVTANNKINAIDKWQFCGVFENLNKSGLNRVYPPEANPISTSGFDAESNGTVNWYTAKETKEPYYFFSNHEEFGSGVNYAQTFVNSEITKRVLLRMGNGSAFKVWLNDVLILENDEDRTTDLNGYQVELTLPKGNNRLLIKNAEGGSGSYFAVSLFDEDKNIAKGLTYSAEYSAYNKSIHSEINPKLIANEFELFFENKIKSNPSDFFYKYCLVNTYLRNGRYKEAKAILLPILKKYPKSSLLRRLILKVYLLEDNYTKINEIVKNMELDDEAYYLPLVLRLMDSDKVKEMSIAELTTFLDKLKKTTDMEIMETTASLILNARKQNMELVKKDFEKLLDQSRDRKDASLLLKYSSLYGSLYNDDGKTIALLEEINNDYFSFGALSNLAYYYEKQNDNQKAIDLFQNTIKHLSIENSFLKPYERKLYDDEQFEESLITLDRMLDNFPYSFVALKRKGETLLRLGRQKEAIRFLEKSLSYDSANRSLRKKINDLKGVKDPIDAIELKDVYDFLAKNRNTIKTNNYGYNILLDEGYTELYSEGGGHSKFIYAYEITSDAGVEKFKEYNLGLSGQYTLNKTEIVKPDGSLSPADRSGSNLVFNNLSIGDVVYVNYDYSFSKTGRFYKDYTDYYQLNSFHPVIRTSYNLIVPKNKKIQHTITHNENNQAKFTVRNSGIHKIYSWTLENSNCLPQAESYMPKSSDLTSNVHVSTIEKWDDIAVWYSDLVRSRVKINATVKETFDQLFPKGYEQFSELERAKIIYNYIVNDFNYSYVSFRQSGYVPQMPSKTIDTKLGDCKDFSTLFVTLGKMAKLNANLVLVLTADNGKDSLILPGVDFNHCIVRLIVGGKEQYLELTMKYLPFGAQPVSLQEATALNIPYALENREKASLIKLIDIERNLTKKHIKANISLTKLVSKMDIVYTISGHTVPSYIEKFNEPNLEVKNKSFFNLVGDYISSDFTLDKFEEISRKPVTYQTNITVNEKLKEIGSIKIYKLPKLSNPYTSDVASVDKRSFPIDYTKYENTDEYQIDYDIKLSDGEKFVEVPKSKSFQFKKHSYQLTYTLASETNLKVSMKAKTSFDEILPEDYQEFKTYINNVLESDTALIGFQ